MAAIVYLVTQIWQQPFALFVSIGLLGCSLLRFFFPAAYKLTPIGIETTFLGWKHSHRWKDFHRFSFDAHGAFLSPFQKSHPLDSFRGIHLPFGAHREQVIEYIEDIFKSRPVGLEESPVRLSGDTAPEAD